MAGLKERLSSRKFVLCLIVIMVLGGALVMFRAIVDNGTLQIGMAGVFLTYALYSSANLLQKIQFGKFEVEMKKNEVISITQGPPTLQVDLNNIGGLQDE